MSTCKPFAAVAALLASGWVAAAAAQEGPHLGVPMSPADIAAWDISIGPSGAGLPQGSGTASAGASVYNTKCIACHGEKGAGKPSDQLVGGNGTLRDAAPVRTVGSYWPYATTLFDYIRRAMPWPQPQSLSRRRGLLADRVPAVLERRGRRNRRHERDDAAEGRDAEPRQLRRRLPRAAPPLNEAAGGGTTQCGYCGSYSYWLS